MSELEKLWPLKKFPVLLDDGKLLAESSIIIEYLAIRHPGRIRLIPDEPRTVDEARPYRKLFPPGAPGRD